MSCLYKKIHVPSMLAKGIKHNRQTSSHNGLEINTYKIKNLTPSMAYNLTGTLAKKIYLQPQWLRKCIYSHNGLEKLGTATMA